MHDDLRGRQAAGRCAQGYAHPKQVAIYGGSYGGYATLVGLTFTPDEFACGVDIVGPSSIVTLIKSIPPYWVPIKSVFDKRVGKVDTEVEFLNSRSPLFKADQIKRAAAHRPGRQRPAREAGRKRPDRRRHAEEPASRSSTWSSPTKATASRAPRTG